MTIQLFSSDLNGTLVHQHTMMDMIRLGFPEEPMRYEKAKHAFTLQTAGKMSMQEAFAIAGPLTQGLSLRNAIEYARSEMRFVKGFDEFISALDCNGIYFVINSTGYSVTTEVIQCTFGAEKFHSMICNRLVFGWNGNPEQSISEIELANFITRYFQGDPIHSCYDQLVATGDVELKILDEDMKAELLFQRASEMNIPKHSIVHMGDTMGDSGGISEVARAGGIGIAFNYNDALENYLQNMIRNEKISGRIILGHPKGDDADLNDVLNKIGIRRA